MRRCLDSAYLAFNIVDKFDFKCEKFKITLLPLEGTRPASMHFNVSMDVAVSASAMSVMGSLTARMGQTRSIADRKGVQI